MALLVIVTATMLRADRVDDYVAAQTRRFDARHFGGCAEERNNRQNKHRTVWPISHAKVYKIGSISKQFIASGIMLLVQDGRMKLDEPVSANLTGTPPAWQAITARHLLTHTSGLVRKSPGFEPMKAQTDGEVIQAAYSVPIPISATTYSPRSLPEWRAGLGAVGYTGRNGSLYGEADCQLAGLN